MCRNCHDVAKPFCKRHNNVKRSSCGMDDTPLLSVQVTFSICQESLEFKFGYGNFFLNLHLRIPCYA